MKVYAPPVSEPGAQSGNCNRPTDRWHINEGLCATCQCSRFPNLEQQCIFPKVIQIHLLRNLISALSYYIKLYNRAKVLKIWVALLHNIITDLQGGNKCIPLHKRSKELTVLIYMWLNNVYIVKFLHCIALRTFYNSDLV